jgi:hypothetical protein
MTEHPSSPLKSVLLIGVHDSGKTNFLSRFWIALDAGNGALAKAGLPKDLDYLRTGADHLLRGEFAPHTSYDVYENTEIPVRSSDATGAAFIGSLEVPDLPGEQIPGVFRSRQWSQKWEDKIQAGCSCLIFVRIDSEELIAPLDWINCIALLGATPPTVSSTTDAANKTKPPTQVILVDWLQFLREAFTDRVGGEYKPRVGIVVTAWDKAPMEQQPLGAEPWIAANLPMLSQFIETNDDAFEFQYFGVSVTSGDFVTDPDFKSTYMDGDPRQAGDVVHSLDGEITLSHDMTIPVAWALGIAHNRARRDE